MIAGFHPHASGLLVPEEHAREREVWTKDEWRLMDRVFKLLESRGLEVFLGCTHPDCKGKSPIERRRQPDGGYLLRCPHKDRVFQRVF